MPLSQPNREDAWFNKEEMARIFDMSPQGFDKSIRPHVPSNYIRTKGKYVLFYAKGVVEIWAQRKEKPEREDPMLDVPDGSSEALERYRDERAKMARIDRLRKEGELLPREKVRTILGRVAAVLRRTGDKLQRQFGQQALEVFEEGLMDAESVIDEVRKEGADGSGA